MKWLRVKVDYYSDFIKETKEKIIGIFSELGVNEFEFIDFLSLNGLECNGIRFKQLFLWELSSTSSVKRHTVILVV